MTETHSLRREGFQADTAQRVVHVDEAVFVIALTAELAFQTGGRNVSREFLSTLLTGHFYIAPWGFVRK